MYHADLADMYPLVVDDTPLEITRLRERLQALEASKAAAHQEAELALRERDARFRHLIEGSLQGILIHRANQALFVNQAYATIMGYDSPEDILSLPSVEALISPHEYGRLRGYREARLAGRPAPSHYEYQGMRRDGTLVWLDMQVRVVSWSSEQALQSTIVDISKRKQIEADLQESESRYRVLWDSAILGVAMLQHGRYLFANTSLVKLLGYEQPKALQGRDYWEHIPEAEHARLRTDIERHRLGKPGPACYELQVTKRDGTKLWVQYTLACMRWRGEAVGLATVQDITERKRAEAEVLARESQFRTLAEHSLAGIYIIQDGRYQYVNPKFADIFGYTQEEITTEWRPGDAWVAEADRSRLDEHVGKRLRREIETHRDGFCGRHKDGTRIDVEVYGTTIEYHGRPAVIGTLLEMTERNRLEAISRQTQRLASLGILASGIAHELHNPLGMMLLAADEAKDISDHPGAHRTITECLETITMEGMRCEAIVESLLQFSRQEPVAKWPDDLNRVIRHAVELTRSYAAGHHTRLECALASALPAARMNPILIEQVLINLIRNGIEAGARHVWVRSHQVGDGRVQCIVQDNGRGIEPGEQPHLFDPFYTTRRQTGGTGLGLSIVRRIIEEHQGTIEVESQPNHGTTFTVSFLSLATGDEVQS